MGQLGSVFTVNVRARQQDGCLAKFQDAGGAELIMRIPEAQYRRLRAEPIRCAKCEMMDGAGKPMETSVYLEWFDHLVPDQSKLSMPAGKWTWVSSRMGLVFDTPTGLLGPGDFFPGDSNAQPMLITDDGKGLILEKTEYVLAGKLLTLTPKALQALASIAIQVY